MKNLFNIVLLFTLVSIIIGTPLHTHAQLFHIPENGLNTLLLRKEYDVKLSVMGRSKTRDQIHQAKVQFACSPIKHLSIDLGYFQLKENDFRINRQTGFIGETFSFNIGTYFQKGTDQFDKHKNILLTLKLGISNSTIEAKTSEFNSNFRTKRYFTQLSFGHHFKRWSWDLFFKYNRLGFLSGTVDLDVVEPAAIESFSAIEQEKFFNTMEYKGQLTMGAGFLEVMTGFSYEIPMHKTERFYFLEGGGIYFGAIIHFNKFVDIVKYNSKKNLKSD